MSTPVIVTGASGRMGSTVIRLIRESEEHELAGVVERPACVATLEGFACTAGTDLGEVIKAAPGAVLIDFTAPEASVENARVCAEHGAAMVCGTTGLTEGQQAVLAEAARKTPLLWAPNMSVGVNVLLEILPRLVQLLGPDYDTELVELHHKHKVDAPSGTALKLAEVVAEAKGQNLAEVGRYSREGIIGERTKEEIGVQTIRGGDVVGVHTVYFLGPGERIELTHQAHSRDTLAAGSLRAAKWLKDQQPGTLYTMLDMLG